jgi:hypothetical protein
MSEPVGNIPRASIPGNTHKDRAASEPPKTAREPVEKMVTGKVTVKKPNFFKRFGRSMVADDVGNVGDFVVSDVLVPAMRNLIYDIIVKGAGRTIFGSGQMYRGSRTGGVGSAGPVSSLKTAYHRVSNEADPGRAISSSSAARHDFGDIVLEDRIEAIQVLEYLQARLEMYRSVTVGDFYDALGTTGGFVDRSWGWTNLDTADIRQVRDGYVFDLPRAVNLR